MKKSTAYIMRDQVKDQITSLMQQKITYESEHTETKMHLLSIAIVSTVYMVAMAFSS